MGTLQYLIISTIEIYKLLIIARVLFSWLPSMSNHVDFAWVVRLTEPVIMPIRLFLEKYILKDNNVLFDFSPLIVYIILELLLSFMY